MVRKICPICDQVMSMPHYCKNCRSWVKHPYVRDVNYYLNERHPEDEANCSYHEGGTGAAGAKRTGGWISGQSGAAHHPEQTSVPNRPSHPEQTSVPNRPSHPEQTSVPNRPSHPERASVPNRPSHPEQFSVPNRPFRPAKPEILNRPGGTGGSRGTGILMLIVVLVLIKLLGSCASLGFHAAV